MTIAKEPLPLETPIGDEEDSHLGDFIEDRNAMLPIDAAIQSNLRDATTQVLGATAFHIYSPMGSPIQIHLDRAQKTSKKSGDDAHSFIGSAFQESCSPLLQRCTPPLEEWDMPF